MNATLELVHQSEAKQVISQRLKVRQIKSVNDDEHAIKCMHQTGFSLAAAVPQSRITELCSSAAVVPQRKSTKLRSSAAAVSQSKSAELCSSAAVVPQSKIEM